MFIGNLEPDRHIGRLARPAPSRTGFGFLRRHRTIKACGIDRTALFTQRILSQIKRKTKSVIELERCIARQICAVWNIVHCRIQKL